MTINLTERDQNRRFGYALRVTYAPGKTKRPKTLRCLWCGDKVPVAPRGRVRQFCSQTCRQYAYMQRKFKRPAAVEALAHDIATSQVRTALRREIWALLQAEGAVTTPEPPALPPRRRPRLRLVEPP